MSPLRAGQEPGTLSVPSAPPAGTLGRMSDVTRLLDAAAAGDRHAAAELLPLVYDELRKLAAARLAAEPPGHTLQPTALVHEAYLRLVGRADARPVGRPRATSSPPPPRPCVASDRPRPAEAGRQARRRPPRGPNSIPTGSPAEPPTPTQLLDLDEALTRLDGEDPVGRRVVELRVFAGLSVEDAADALGLSRATAYRHWAYARAWLTARLSETDGADSADS